MIWFLCVFILTNKTTFISPNDKQVNSNFPANSAHEKVFKNQLYLVSITYQHSVCTEDEIIFKNSNNSLEYVRFILLHIVYVSLEIYENLRLKVSEC